MNSAEPRTPIFLLALSLKNSTLPAFQIINTSVRLNYYSHVSCIRLTRIHLGTIFQFSTFQKALSIVHCELSIILGFLPRTLNVPCPNLPRSYPVPTPKLPYTLRLASSVLLRTLRLTCGLPAAMLNLTIPNLESYFGALFCITILYFNIVAELLMPTPRINLRQTEKGDFLANFCPTKILGVLIKIKI